MDIISRIDKFVADLDSNTKIALLHDTDPDGVCSGVLFAKAIERLRGKGIDFRLVQKHNDVQITEETIKELKNLKPDWLIITDKSVDTNPSTVKEAEKYCSLLVFDHHRILADLNSEKTIFAKAQYINKNIDGSLYPTTKLVYDIFSKYVDLSDLDWVAAVGVIADMAQRQWILFLDTTFAIYNVDKGTNYFDTPIGKVSGLISIADTCGKSEEAFDVLYFAKSYQEMHASKLKDYQAAVQKEINRILEEFPSKKEAYPEKELYYYEIGSPYALNSMISTILSMKDRNKAFIVVQKAGTHYNISARRQDNQIAMNELLANAVKGLEDAHGGGHRPAAGGKFLVEDKEIVKKRLLGLLS